MQSDIRPGLLPGGDNGHTVSKLDEALRTSLAVIFNGNPASREGVTMREGKSHLRGLVAYIQNQRIVDCIMRWS